METNHILDELMQSWIVVKHLNSSKINNYLSKSLETYMQYSSFIKDMENNLESENSLKLKGYPVDKKKKYLNSEKCLNKSKIVLDCLENYLQNYEKNNLVFNKFFVKVDQIYKKLEESNIEVNSYLEKKRGIDLSKMILKFLKNEMNSNPMNNNDLVKKYEIVENCLNNYNILNIMNNKEKVKGMKKEIGKIYDDCYKKINDEGLFKKISNFLK